MCWGKVLIRIGRKRKSKGYLAREFRNALLIDNIMLKSMAVKSPSIWNPGTIADVSCTRRAFRSRENNPRVIRVRGNVSRVKIGLMKVFIIPRTIATRNVVVRLSTVTPGSM